MDAAENRRRLAEIRAEQGNHVSGGGNVGEKRVNLGKVIERHPHRAPSGRRANFRGHEAIGHPFSRAELVA